MSTSRVWFAVVSLAIGHSVGSPAFGGVLLKDPAFACAALSDSGLGTGGWTDHDGSQFGCSSDYKEIGMRSAEGMPNNLAYYVEGGRSNVRRLKLVLNVNQPRQAVPAHRALLDASMTLSPKATGVALPRHVQDAIRTARSGRHKVGASTVTLTRETWPTARGYEVSVTFE